MTEESAPQWSTPLIESEHSTLRSLGFTPAAPVFTAEIGFMLKDVRNALFKTTVDSPRTLLFRVDPDGGSWWLSLFVLSARAVWWPFGAAKAPVPVGPFPHPNWYLEGLLFTAPLQFTEKPTTMRAYIDGIEQFQPEVFIQVDRFRANVPEDAPLRFGTGAPGQLMPDPAPGSPSE